MLNVSGLCGGIWDTNCSRSIVEWESQVPLEKVFTNILKCIRLVYYAISSSFQSLERVRMFLYEFCPQFFFVFFLRIVLVLFKISFYGSILIILYTLNKKKKIRKHKRISYYYSLLYHFASTYSRFCQNEIRLSILVSRHQILSGPVPWHNSISWKNPVSKTIWVQRFKCLSPRATFFVI